MEFVFRADASATMGSGHIMRSLALAEILLERGHGCHFGAAELPEALRERLVGAGVTIRMLDVAADRLADATLALIDETDAAGVIVDGYQFDPVWRRALKSCGRPVLALWDDVSSHPTSADLALNPAASPADDPTLLYGPRYMLLRREFTAAARLPPLSMPARNRVLVTFGGSDPTAMTFPVTTSLRQMLGPEIPLDVVIGGAVPDAVSIAADVVEIGGQISVHLDTRDMGRLMRHAGLAVSAAGGTIGELAALGVPAVLVPVVDNQAAGVAAASAGGWFHVVSSRDVDEIARTAATLWADIDQREAQSIRARHAVATDGAARAIDALLALVVG